MEQAVKEQTGALIEHENYSTPAATGEALTPMAMLDRAVQQGANVEVLEKLMGLQERWEANQARKAFDEAMASAKSEIPMIRKSREVDFTSSKGRTHYRYEDLAEVAKTVNPILSKHGLSYRFRTSSLPNEPVTVTCVVSHRLGYSEENTLSAGRDESGNKNSIQAVGSTLTYLQRMTLKAALGLAASEDDDNNAAGASETITEAQCDELTKLCDDLGVDKVQFCRAHEIASIAQISAANYEAAKSAIRQKGGRS